MLALFALLQVLRVWTLRTLGARWTTRIIVVPGETLVARGPYRFVDHPNYVVVVGEIAVLPLVFGLWWVAVVFTLLNAAMLCWRSGIRAGERRRAAARSTSLVACRDFPRDSERAYIALTSPRHRQDVGAGPGSVRRGKRALP